MMLSRPRFLSSVSATYQGAQPVSVKRAHHPLDTGAVVPTAVEDDDLPRRRQMRHIPLDVHLRLLTFRRRRQCHHSEHPRADPLGDGLDHPTLAGRVTAGKGGVIKAITERVSPRVFRVVALPAPTEREKSQMYIQRYVPHLPAAGEVVIFDRSWYNRAGVERVMGPLHRHRLGALVRRQHRRQEARPAQHHRASARPGSLHAAGAAGDRAAPCHSPVLALHDVLTPLLSRLGRSTRAVLTESGAAWRPARRSSAACAADVRRRLWYYPGARPTCATIWTTSRPCYASGYGYEGPIGVLRDSIEDSDGIVYSPLFLLLPTLWYHAFSSSAMPRALRAASYPGRRCALEDAVRSTSTTHQPQSTASFRDDPPPHPHHHAMLTAEPRA